MNKKLLAVAVGTALAGSIGIAQADVQLFGQLDTSIDSHDCQTNCNGYSAYQGYTKSDGSHRRPRGAASRRRRHGHSGAGHSGAGHSGAGHSGAGRQEAGCRRGPRLDRPDDR